jgi:hypothetical protein
LTSLITLAVAVATAIQAWVSAIELGRANRGAVDTWTAEDELTAEQPRRQRRRTRRLLKAERDRELHAEIVRIQLTLGSWVTLVAASLAAFAQSVWP